MHRPKFSWHVFIVPWQTKLDNTRHGNTESYRSELQGYRHSENYIWKLQKQISSIIIFVYAGIITIKYYQILSRRTHLTKKSRQLFRKIRHSKKPGSKRLCNWPNNSYWKGIAFALQSAFCDLICFICQCNFFAEFNFWVLSLLHVVSNLFAWLLLKSEFHLY